MSPATQQKECKNGNSSQCSGTQPTQGHGPDKRTQRHCARNRDRQSDAAPDPARRNSGGRDGRKNYRLSQRRHGDGRSGAGKEEVKEPEPNQNQKAIRQKTDKEIVEEIELHALLIKTGVMEMMNSILRGRLNGEITFTLKGVR